MFAEVNGEGATPSSIRSVKAELPKISKPKPYHECSYYNYFPNDNTNLTDEDSMALYSYASRVKVEYKTKAHDESVEFSRLTNFLPRIWNTVDKEWYDKLMLDKQSKARYKSLNWVDLAGIINSDAIIVGKIIDIENHIDTNRCFYFKRSFYIKIKEVVNASFDLKEGDIVQIKHGTGYMGDCSKYPSMFMSSNMGKEYKIGETNVFFLQHYKYKAWFVKLRQDEGKRERFSDEFCSNAFIIPFNNHKYDISNVDLLGDIRLFFENKDELLKILYPDPKKKVDAPTSN